MLFKLLFFIFSICYAYGDRVITLGPFYSLSNQAKASFVNAGVLKITHAGLKMQWIASSDTTVIVMGNSIGKNFDTLGTVEFLEDVRKACDEAQGNLVFLHGQQEWIVMSNSYSVPHKQDILSFGGLVKRKERLGPFGDFGRAFFAVYRPYFIKNGVLYAHHILSRDAAKMTPEDIRRELMEVKSEFTISYHNKKPKVMFGRNGPLMKTFKFDAEETECEEVEKVLKMKKVRMMVVGLRLPEGRVGSRCNGKLLFVDTVSSLEYTHMPETNEYNTITEISPDGIFVTYKDQKIKVGDLPEMPEISEVDESSEVFEESKIVTLDEQELINGQKTVDEEKGKDSNLARDEDLISQLSIDGRSNAPIVSHLHAVYSEKNPFPAVEQPKVPIFAVGDLHGDIVVTRKALQSINLLSRERDQWIGGKAILVQTGDVVDRGPAAKEIWDLLRNLKRQAIKAGGDVIMLLGNHETNNLLGEWTSVSEEDCIAFARDLDHKTLMKLRQSSIDSGFRGEAINVQVGKIQRAREFMDDGGRLRKFLLGLDTTIKLGDTVFVHAGITPEYAVYGLDAINKNIRYELQTRKTFSQIPPILLDDGPLWSRAFSGPNKDERIICPELEKSLRILNAKRMVVGHSPQTNGKINSRCNGQLVMIDIAASAWMWGRPMPERRHVGALKIEPNGEAYAIYPDEIVPIPLNDEVEKLFPKHTPYSNQQQQHDDDDGHEDFEDWGADFFPEIQNI